MGPKGYGKGWWRGKFQGCGYRFTLPRQVILDVLSSKPGHLSAEDVYISVHNIYPQIGLTTVYRTLELLFRMGVVAKYDFGEGRARYELAVGKNSQGHHHHLICTICGIAIDYNDFTEREKSLLKEVEEELVKKYNFKITNHIIQFHGICKKCQEKG